MKGLWMDYRDIDLKNSQFLIVGKDDGCRIERMIHEKLSSCRINHMTIASGRTEWFIIDKQDFRNTLYKIDQLSKTRRFDYVDGIYELLTNHWGDFILNTHIELNGKLEDFEFLEDEIKYHINTIHKVFTPYSEYSNAMRIYKHNQQKQKLMVLEAV